MRLRAPRVGGGLADPAPFPDEPKGRALTAVERGAIQAGLRQGWSFREIGDLIGRDKSVVWREVRRNVSADGVYYGSAAHSRAHQARRRPKPFRLNDERLCSRIAEWMDQGWSPGLIARMLAAQSPDGETGRVSHETIYRALYVQARGHLRQDLARKLSTKRTARKPRGSADRRGRAIYEDALTISERPAEAADRAIPGHWEGDLIVGSESKSAIGTLVERTTRFVILLHLPGRHTADEVANAMIREMSGLPQHLRRSITWDRGSEMADYERIRLDLGAPVYFADPHSPWQRGSNENTNRLLRFWFEKGTDLSTWTAAEIRQVQDTLNRRPRPTLGLKTPAQALNELLARAA
jgi:IS30 family transposase